MKIDKATGTTVVTTTEKGIETRTPVGIEVPLAASVEADEAEDAQWGKALAKKVAEIQETTDSLVSTVAVSKDETSKLLAAKLMEFDGLAKTAASAAVVASEQIAAQAAQIATIKSTIITLAGRVEAGTVTNLQADITALLA